MIQEFDLVVLTEDMPEHRLQKGDVGAVVHAYTDSVGYEVEFVTAEGETIAVLTLTTANIRALAAREILHVRDVDVALA